MGGLSEEVAFEDLGEVHPGGGTASADTLSLEVLLCFFRASMKTRAVKGSRLGREAEQAMSVGPCIARTEI